MPRPLAGASVAPPSTYSISVRSGTRRLRTRTNDSTTTRPPPTTKSTSGIGRSYLAPNAWARTATSAVRVDHAAQRTERLGLRAVVDVGALARPLDEARLAQLLEVVADGRVGQVEQRGEVARADARVRLGQQDAHQLHPNRIGERLQPQRQREGVCGGQHPGRERRTADGRGGVDGRQRLRRHGLILTHASTYIK